MVEWITSSEPVPYLDSLNWMEQRVSAISIGEADEAIWLLEHPSIYTAGTSAGLHEISDSPPFPLYRVGRGGKITYHGPGQRVIYILLNLNKRQRDLRRFVGAIEAWIIAALAEFNIEGFPAKGRTGVWLHRDAACLAQEAKIAAIGIRMRRWVSFHGASVNVNPDLGHYAPIVPCGIREHGVTSLAQIGSTATMADLDAALKKHFNSFFC